MSRTVKVAISLPEELLEVAEREREARQESRSEFFRQALESFLRRERERAAVQRYIQGYREQPETEVEIAAAQQLSTASLAENPWE